MRAIRFENQKILTTDAPIPVQNPGEALVRVLMVGICGTDIAIFHGYAGFKGIPGHEFAGIVEECHDHPELVGKRVVSDINFGCGHCIDEKHCPDRSVLGIRGKDGAFAQYCSIPAKNLFVLNNDILTAHAVFTEPLAAALCISQQVHINSQSRVAVIGDGCLGILCAISLKHCAGSINLLGRHREKLSIAEQQGVNTFLTGQNMALDEVVRKTGQFDITVDATGNPEGINWCIGLTRPCGTVVAKSTAAEKHAINLADVVVNELVIQGSRCGDLSAALDFLEKKKIDVNPLIEAVYPFSQFKEAFAHAMKKGSLKILVDVNR